MLPTSQHRNRKIIPTSQHYGHTSTTNITKQKSHKYCQNYNKTFS